MKVGKTKTRRKISEEAKKIAENLDGGRKVSAWALWTFCGRICSGNKFISGSQSSSIF